VASPPSPSSKVNDIDHIQSTTADPRVSALAMGDVERQIHRKTSQPDRCCHPGSGLVTDNADAAGQGDAGGDKLPAQSRQWTGGPYRWRPPPPGMAQPTSRARLAVSPNGKGKKIRDGNAKPVEDGQAARDNVDGSRAASAASMTGLVLRSADHWSADSQAERKAAGISSRLGGASGCGGGRLGRVRRTVG